MTVESDGVSVDQHVGISFGDHTVIVPGHRTGALVADAGDRAAHDDRLRFTRFYRSAVRCRIADTYHSAHLSVSVVQRLPARALPLLLDQKEAPCGPYFVSKRRPHHGK